MAARLDIATKRFGRLTATEIVGPSKYGTLWRCACDCGGTATVVATKLTRGRIRSCGCLQVESGRIQGKKSRRHGRSWTPTWRSWNAAVQRCTMPGRKNYDRYGGRGIKVCERWSGEHGFENFLADMGERPSLQHSLDRRDVNGHYEPSNCRWATRLEQARNTRKTKVTDTVAVAAIAMRQAGRSVIAIAAELGLSPSHASRVSRGVRSHRRVA